MADRSRISVIVPVYNVEKYIRMALNSVLNQSYGNLEILLIDDGSTDSSGRICDEYAAADERIRVIHQKNGGAANAKNTGLNIATGEYLAFLDSDDFLEPDAYEYMHKKLEEKNADAIQCSFRNVYCGGSIEECVTVPGSESFSPAQFLERFTVDWTCGLLWDKLYRRSIFNGIRFEEGHKIDDEFFTYRGIMNANKILHEPKIVYNYRKRRSGVMLSPESEKRIVLDKLAFISTRRTTVTAHFPELSRSYDSHFLNMLLILAHDPGGTPDSIREIKKLISGYIRQKRGIIPPRLLRALLAVLLTPAERLLEQRAEVTVPGQDEKEYFE